jgi:hypothetical protein
VQSSFLYNCKKSGTFFYIPLFLLLIFVTFNSKILASSSMLNQLGNLGIITIDNSFFFYTDSHQMYIQPTLHDSSRHHRCSAFEHNRLLLKVGLTEGDYCTERVTAYKNGLPDITSCMVVSQCWPAAMILEAIFPINPCLQILVLTFVPLAAWWKVQNGIHLFHLLPSGPILHN